MPTNAEAAAIFREIADLLDLQGIPYKPEAYRRAARSIETLGEELSEVAARDELETIPGVGEAIAEKIREFLAQGKLPYYERLRTEVPDGIVELMHLPGVGPKTAHRLWAEVGVEGPAELEAAIAAGRLEGLKGIKARKIEQFREALGAARARAGGARVPIESVYGIARSIVEALRTRAPTDAVEVAGSFRRGRETVGDLDVLATSDDPPRVFDVFSSLPELKEVRLRGGTKETAVLRNGLQVDLRVVEPASFGAALQYFTGSKEHNVHLRSLARDRGLKINEYGVFRKEERIGGRTETEVYAALGLPWIPPELREDRGEIEAATGGTLPKLVERGDLVGELHLHLEERAKPKDLDRALEAGATRGLRFVGVVVGGTRADGSVWTLPEPVRRSLTSARRRPLKVLPVVETGPGPLPGPVAKLDPAYRIVRPQGSSPPTPGAPSFLVAHVGGDLSVVRPWIEFAQASRAAIETGPGPDRIDSTAARAAREAGVPLSVPLGLTEADGSPDAEVALGFARRAGATKKDVANARDVPRASGAVRRPRR